MTLKDFNDFSLRGTYFYPTGKLPECRDQFSLCSNGVNEIYMFSGLQSTSSTDVWVFNLVKQQWSKKTAIKEVISRFGHTGIYYNRNIFYFGGCGKNVNHKYNLDLEIYNIDENIFKTPNISAKMYLNVRKGHIAEIVGSQMFIHGGFNEDDKILNDSYTFNLIAYKWIPCIMANDNGPYLAYHASSLALPYDTLSSSKLSLYTLPEQFTMKKSNSKAII